MRKQTDCPKCKDEVLSLWVEGDKFQARCIECGWTTGEVVLSTGQELNEVLAAKVAAAKKADTPLANQSESC